MLSEDKQQKQGNAELLQMASGGEIPPSGAPSAKIEKILQNTGEFFLRQRILSRWLEDLEERIKAESDYVLFQRCIGERDGIFETMGHTHEKVIEQLVDTKKVLAGLEDTSEAESEYFDFEKPYIEGYINGIEQTLRAGRETFEEPIPFALIIVTAVDEVRASYEAVFQAIPAFKPISEPCNKRYLVTTSTSEAEQAVRALPEGMEYMLCYIYGHPSNPPVAETLQCLSEFSEDNLFIVKDVMQAGQPLKPEKVVRRLIRAAGLT